MEKTNEYYNERIDFILSEKSRIESSARISAHKC